MKIRGAPCFAWLCLIFLLITYRCMDHSMSSASSAQDMFLAMKGRAQEWRQNKHQENFWSRAKGPAPLIHCLPESLGAIASTRFGIVALLSSDASNMYLKSAQKLARSIRMWIDSEQMDLVLMTTQGFGFSAQPNAGLTTNQKLLREAGWTVFCSVPPIQHPLKRVESRFHDARTYSKLNLWALVQYEALLFLDLDTLVIREPTRIFTEIYPEMESKGFELAATPDRPESFSDHFNSGVLLVKPKTSVEELVSMIAKVEHDQEWADQAFLNAVFRYRFLPLPFIYNANVISKMLEPVLWHQNQDMIAIVHYTVAKGWHSFRNMGKTGEFHRMFACWFYDLDDLCQLWEQV